VLSIPVGAWWYQARRKREEIAHDVATRIRIPGQQTVDDFLIEKCRPGDVLVFDRRWETCASGPWAALACILSKLLLCRHSEGARSVERGEFNHIGIIVPGYEKSRHDEFDPSNFLLLEATPQGIVARSLKTRLERTQSRSVLLLQLNAPGEQRDFVNLDDDYEEMEESQLSSRQLSVRRARRHVEKELVKFRDSWVSLGEKNHFKYMFSTLSIGGALAHGIGFNQYLSGPVSPSAWLVVMALQQAAAAQNVHVRNERWSIKPEDFLRADHKLGNESNPLRLRPGWRFLAPMAISKEPRAWMTVTKPRLKVICCVRPC